MESLIQDVSRIIEQAENGKGVWMERSSQDVKKQESESMDLISNHFELLYESCHSVESLTAISPVE